LDDKLDALTAKVDAGAPVTLTDAQLESLAANVAGKLGTLQFVAE
jgi:hypothetical protein